MCEMTRCDLCGTKKSLVTLTNIEINGERRTVWLCEKCYDKHEKPFKKQNNVNNK